jgi:hypothetical protein
MSNELDRPLYDCVPEWSPQRKEAFTLYRDLGPQRSLAAVSQRLSKDPSLIGKWSMEDSWVMRAAAWDAEQDRVRQETMRAEVEKVTRRHAKMLEDTLTVLMQPALKLAAMIENGDERMLEDADPITLANLAAQAGKQLPQLITASRLVHGVSTQNIEAKTEQRQRIEGASPTDLDNMLTNFDDGTDEIIEGTATERDSE